MLTQFKQLLNEQWKTFNSLSDKELKVYIYSFNFTLDTISKIKIFFNESKSKTIENLILEKFQNEKDEDVFELSFQLNPEYSEINDIISKEYDTLCELNSSKILLFFNHVDSLNLCTTIKGEILTYFTFHYNYHTKKVSFLLNMIYKMQDKKIQNAKLMDSIYKTVNIGIEELKINYNQNTAQGIDLYDEPKFPRIMNSSSSFTNKFLYEENNRPPISIGKKKYNASKDNLTSNLKNLEKIRIIMYKTNKSYELCSDAFNSTNDIDKSILMLK